MQVCLLKFNSSVAVFVVEVQLCFTRQRSVQECKPLELLTRAERFSQIVSFGTPLFPTADQNNQLNPIPEAHHHPAPNATPPLPIQTGVAAEFTRAELF